MQPSKLSTAAVPSFSENDLLTLWSVRDAVELEALERGGALRTAPEKVLDEFKPAYAWMKEKLAAKVSPPAGVTYPIWAWYWAEGRGKPRPDLRKKWGERGQDMALVEFSLPAGDVLLSDYQTWHFPLNGWYLARSEADQHAFDRDSASVAPPTLKKMIETSWDAVLDWGILDEAYHGCFDDKQIQAVVWEIPEASIRSIRRFRSR